VHHVGILYDQEISTFMQDINKNNQETQDSSCQSELANA